LSQEFGFINPEIVWGMTKDLIPGRGIKPEVKLDLFFFRDNIREEQYIAANSTNGMEIRKSANFLNLGLFIGMGGFTIQQINNFKWGLDFEYGLNLFFYDNEYGFTDDAGRWHIGRVSGITNDLGSPLERSRHFHLVVPSLSASWSDDRLKLSSRFGMNLRIISNEEALLTRTEIPVKQGLYTKRTELLFFPVLDLGMQWAIIPERFFLNAGGVINLGSLEFIMTEQMSFDQGVETSGSGTKTTNLFSNGNGRQGQHGIGGTGPATTTRLHVGFMFYPASNIGLQVKCGINTASNTINVFDTGSQGFFSFANFIATVQF
jgi:hypothetical protein